MASYRKLGKDNWQYIVDYKDESGKRKFKTKSGFRTKSAAKEIAEELEITLKKNKNIINRDMLFTDYYEKWIHTHKLGRYSKSTDTAYRTAKKLVNEHFRDLKLSDLTMDHYQIFINDISKTRALETVRKNHQKVSSALRHAWHSGIIPIDVTYNVKLSGLPGKSPADKFMEEEELNKFIEELKKSSNLTWTSHYMLILQSSTGMRIAEVMAITFDDIDFKNETLRINKSWDYKDTRTFKDTKNGVHRTIDLDRPTLAWLKEYVIFQKERMLSSRFDNPKNLLFTNKYFEPLTVDGVNETMKSVCARIGIGTYTTHHLRHTHASKLLSGGVDIEIVAERLGDTSQTIQEVYAHVLQGQRDRNKDLVKKISASIH